jgi:putative transposase
MYRQAYQFRLAPTKGQVRLLAQTLESCRWLYNETLAYRKAAWEGEERIVDWYETKRRIPFLKAERPSLKTVHSQVLQNVTERVEWAFKAFFRRIKASQKPGYPRFRGPGWYDSFTYPQATAFRLEGQWLDLSKIGRVQLIAHRPIDGTIKTLTIRRTRTGKWFACFSVEVESASLPATDSAVGIDVGLEMFATLSTGEQVANPRFFRKDERPAGGRADP